jgi:signal transduction histidine kinase
MKQNNSWIRYLFNLLAMIVLVGSFFVYYAFTQTREKIEKENLRSNITYIDSVTSNIAVHINRAIGDKDLYTALEDDPKLQTALEKTLQLFVNSRYRYVYIVDKEAGTKGAFRFLLDGAKKMEEKSDFLERFTPRYKKIWRQVYHTQKPAYFQHQDTDAVWMTYLKPILKNGTTIGVIAVDFSLQNHHTIMGALKELNTILILALLLGSIVFVTIVFFSVIDRRRIRQLQQKTAEISRLNRTLQDQVEIEVIKNREKEQQLIKQSRLAQMGEMLSMIAHQWRQPLAAIAATSSNISMIIQLDKIEKEKLLSLSEKISEYAQHLSVTIDDFRNFFKPNKEKTQTDFLELTDAVLEIIGTSIRNKNISLVKEVKGKVPFYTYPNEIKQVILNLLKNAEDVLMDKAVGDGKIYITVDGKQLKICDNGGGVPEEIIEDIFDPYFSTKDEKTGTGLGLYMSKTIIEEHCGGKIYVENTPDGACFTIELPSLDRMKN